MPGWESECRARVEFGERRPLDHFDASQAGTLAAAELAIENVCLVARRKEQIAVEAREVAIDCSSLAIASI